MPGWTARVTAVTLQPGTAMRLEAASSSRWARARVGPGAGVVRAVEGLPRLLTGQAVVRAAVDE